MLLPPQPHYKERAHAWHIAGRDRAAMGFNDCFHEA
jgi:hypothetical protein